MRKQPKIHVGILAVEELHFSLTGSFLLGDSEVSTGDFVARINNGKVVVIDDTGNEVIGE